MNIAKKFYSRVNYNAMILRIALTGLFFLSGNMKWFSSEMMLVEELTQKTWLAFLPTYLGSMETSYFLAVFQAAIVLGLVGGIVFPVVGVISAIAAFLSSVITLSVLPAAMDISINGYILKELVAMSTSIFLLHYDMISATRRNKKAIIW